MPKRSVNKLITEIVNERIRMIRMDSQRKGQASTQINRRRSLNQRHIMTRNKKIKQATNDAPSDRHPRNSKEWKI